jgi:hypothetical protein
MTRFKELRRIELAIEHRNLAEIRWAMDYCKMRLQTATRKDHQKYWQRIENELKNARHEERPD